MQLNVILKKIKENFFYLFLIVFSLGILAVSIKINVFRYDNFDFGKFDLGNMSQMAWYTLNVPGKVMWLTDYFGTNLPRWAMSHVDPILLLFVPIFAVFPHSLTLVFIQLILVIFSSLIVYKIAQLKLKSNLSAMFFGLAYLFYPAVGFLLAWTGYHGVTVVIPFFLGAFYVFEKMYHEGKFTSKGLILFWVLLVLTMAGKEQLPLYISIYGLFILFFRGKKFTGLSMFIVGVVWFFLAFFVIIPSFADYRIEGYARFADSLGIDSNLTNDVVKPNYFLSRYEAFGDSYSEIAVNMVLNPQLAVKVFFGGDKLENFRMTFEPLLYMPFAYPALLVVSVIHFPINYMTTEGGIGTAEIYNHRVSMIVPVLFISSIYGVAYIANVLGDRKKFLKKRYLVIFLSGLLLVSNMYTSFAYQNPIYLWLTQAVQKRVPFALVNDVYADDAIEDWEKYYNQAQVGDRFKLPMLDNKDRRCAAGLVNTIDPNASVSGPDYMGAHLGLRETYAIFPSLYNTADVVIVDVFAQKVLRILNESTSLVHDVVGLMIVNPDYKISSACGNLFVFEKVGPHGKTDLLPLQQTFEYDERYDFEIINSLTLVDYSIPEKVQKGVSAPSTFVYTKKEDASFDGYFLYLTFVHKDTGEVYNVANLASFGITEVREWVEDRYYIENEEIVVPKFLADGTYSAFISISNRVKTRSVYLGDIQVQ